MSIILALLFVGVAIGIGYWLERKHSAVRRQEALKPKPSPFWEGIFVHPGHAWVEVVEPSLVAVGADGFTKSVFGSVEGLTLPETGTMIRQGERAWALKRGRRHLSQTAPISGTVVEVNRDLVQNPELLAQKDTKRNWVLKIRPMRLKRELQNLLHGNVLRRWNQAVKEQLAVTLTTAEFPVLQEGGEIKPDLGNDLTPEQWDQVAREFFK
ncbi:hypothetical protein AMJ44_13720 [candidate division WOR-1 bacterium DG_54_3]|uniref:Lipoyl-binding domain-containing protein n=1 Tax=candidate division WOR-1 bacterium DG_54_3 TaxID=1703775 RepID=A0A0S7XNA8_UNCSA|nr:MAG: hypothetical protein AMJ44_13720 [candidate division WOR-1 bacterium DG_54_3]